MKTRYYLVDAEDGSGKAIISLINQLPPSGAVEMPEALATSEDQAWLQVENIQDPVTLEMIPTVTVDEPTKASVLQARVDAELAAEQSKAEKELIKKLKKDAMDAFKNKKLQSLQDIEDALKAIIEYIEQE